MNIRDISPATAIMHPLSNPTNKHPPDNQSQFPQGKPKPAAPAQENTIKEPPITQTRQRIQPLKKPPPINTEPVHLKAGVIKNFVHEIDLVKKQILTPTTDRYERPSLDSLA